MQEACLFGPDVHESGLNAGKNRFDAAQEDISDHSALVGTVQHDLDQLVVFKQRHP